MPRSVRSEPSVAIEYQWASDARWSHSPYRIVPGGSVPVAGACSSLG